MTKKHVWVLTTAYNEYDQYGEYFVAVLSKEPTIEELAGVCTKYEIPIGETIAEGISYLNFLRKGGGRQKNEHQWYILREVELEIQ